MKKNNLFPFQMESPVALLLAWLSDLCRHKMMVSPCTKMLIIPFSFKVNLWCILIAIYYVPFVEAHKVRNEGSFLDWVPHLFLFFVKHQEPHWDHPQVWVDRTEKDQTTLEDQLSLPVDEECRGALVALVRSTAHLSGDACMGSPGWREWSNSSWCCMGSSQQNQRQKDEHPIFFWTLTLKRTLNNIGLT